MFVSHLAAIFFLQVVLLNIIEARVTKQENVASKVQITVPENNTIPSVVSTVEEKISVLKSISQVIENSTTESTHNIKLENVETQLAIVQQNNTDNDTRRLKSQLIENTIKLTTDDDESSVLNSTDMDLTSENSNILQKENKIQKETFLSDPDFKNYSDCVVVEVIPETQKQLDELRKFEFELKYYILSHIRRVGHPLKILTVAKNGDLAQYLKTNNLEKRTTIRDVDKSNFVNNLENTAKKNLPFEEYSDLDDIFSYYKKLSRDKSTNANVALLEEEIRTINNNSIWSVRLTARGSTVKKPTILVIAALHGREWITTVAALKLIDALVYPVKGESSAKPLLDQFDWLIVPVANPDGYDYSRTTNRYWKKNRNRISGETISFGVDLEMNFYTNKWNASKETYLYTTDYYVGRVPFSEIETQHIKHLIKRYQSELIMYISLNSVENFICYPSAYKNKTENNLKTLKSGVSMIKTGMDKVDDTVKYAVGSTDELFDENTGRDIDWAYNIMGLPFAYKIGLHSNVSVAELDVLPKDIERVSQRAVRGIQTLAKYLGQKRGPVRQYLNVVQHVSGNTAFLKTSLLHNYLLAIIINYILINVIN